MDSGKHRRLVSNTAVLGAGTFISKVLVFLLMPLYTAVLSKEQFGIADILSQTANLLMPVAALGVGDGLFRFALDCGEERRKEIFGGAMTVIVAGMFPLALIVQAFRMASIYDGYIWLVFFYVCAANLHLLCANYVRACNKTKAFALQGIANTALTIVLNVLFLLVFDMGVTGYVLSVVLSDAVITVSLFFSCKLYKEIKFNFKDRKVIVSMLKFSIPYIPTTMMWSITSASDRFIVTAISGAAENGLYAAAYKLPTLISLAGGVFIEAWHFSSVNDATPEERTKFFGDVYKNYLCIMFMGSSVLVFASKLLTRILLDDAYYSSWEYVPVLSVAMIFSAFSAFMGSVYFLEKKSLRSLFTATAGAVVNITLNFILIPDMGAMGAAIATVISYVAVFIIRCFDARRFLKFSLSIPRLAVNTVLLVTQTVLMVLEPPYWIIWQFVICTIMLIFNGKDIVLTVLNIFRKKRKNI